MVDAAINKVCLSGIVCKPPIRKVSPAGTPHCQFVLDHRSQQQEAGLNRQAWCRMPVIISGAQANQQMSRHLSVGCRVQIWGFVSSYQSASGLSRLALHAEEIKWMNSGDEPNGTLFPPS